MTERFLRVYSYNIFFKLLSQAIIFWGREKNHILKLKLTPKIFPKWSEHGKVQLYFSSEEKKRGLAAKARLKEILKSNKNKIILESQGVGKYGRCLGIIRIKDTNVNQQLVQEGHAVEYFGGKR